MSALRVFAVHATRCVAIVGATDQTDCLKITNRYRDAVFGPVLKGAPIAAELPELVAKRRGVLATFGSFGSSPTNRSLNR